MKSITSGLPRLHSLISSGLYASTPLSVSPRPVAEDIATMAMMHSIPQHHTSHHIFPTHHTTCCFVYCLLLSSDTRDHVRHYFPTGVPPCPAPGERCHLQRMAEAIRPDHSIGSPSNSNSIPIDFDFDRGTVTTLDDFSENLWLVGKFKSGHLAHQENLSTIAHSKKKKIWILEAASDGGGTTYSQKAQGKGTSQTFWCLKNIENIY